MFEMKPHPKTRSKKRDLSANKNPGGEFIHIYIYIYILKYKIEKVCTEITLSLRKNI